MDMQNIDDVILTLSLIFGFTSYLIYILSSYFLRKRAFAKIKTTLQEDEYIIYKAKIKFIADFLIGFTSMLGYGCAVIPFYLFPELHQIFVPMIGFISRDYLWLWMLVLMFPIYMAFIVCCLVTVLTNKRIINSFAFDFVYKSQKFLLEKVDSLYYSDIKKIIYGKILFIDRLIILTNDNKRHFYGEYLNTKDIKLIIEEQVSLSKGDIENDSTARTSSN